MAAQQYSKDSILRAIEDEWQRTQQVLESDADYPFEDDVEISGDEDLDEDEFED